jgi:hypothetical protein
MILLGAKFSSLGVGGTATAAFMLVLSCADRGRGNNLESRVPIVVRPAPSELPSPSGPPKEVPNVVDQSMETATTFLQQSGFVVTTEGRGKVIRQEPKAGERIRRGPLFGLSARRARTPGLTPAAVEEA